MSLAQIHCTLIEPGMLLFTHFCTHDKLFLGMPWLVVCRLHQAAMFEIAPRKIMTGAHLLHADTSESGVAIA